MPLVVTVFAERFLRATFPSPIAVTPEALEKTNYTLSDGLEALRVLYDADLSELSYVDLLITRPVIDAKYELTVSNLLLAADGSSAGTLSADFITQHTKVDDIVQKFPRMYSKDVLSTLTHILTAIGISDQEIGGGTPSGLAVIPTVGATTPASTYGSGTFGTSTYGGS